MTEDEELRRSTTHCARCGCSILFDPDNDMRAHRLCSSCMQVSLRWSTSILYAAGAILALFLIGILMHFWFPRVAP